LQLLAAAQLPPDERLATQVFVVVSQNAVDAQSVSSTQLDLQATAPHP
jgi:hypothetical protein